MARTILVIQSTFADHGMTEGWNSMLSLLFLRESRLARLKKSHPTLSLHRHPLDRRRHRRRINRGIDAHQQLVAHLEHPIAQAQPW